jgi:hypothetical protein
LASVYGVASFANRAHHLARLDNGGRRGTSQNVLSRDALRVLQTLDSTLPPGALVVVPSPEMALDLQRVRRLPTHAAMMDLPQLTKQRWQGRVEDLVVLVDDRMIASGQAAALLGSFVDYSQTQWRIHRHGEWSFYHQGMFSQWPQAERKP